MRVQFDRWTFLKIVEVCFCVACLICKRITDDEQTRLFLYLQKLSREWSLLNSVTWDRVGSAVADTTYGGYVIITSALLIGRLFSELPTRRRIVEFVLLLLGALLMIILGGLELAALESLPDDLIDNGAVLGGLSLVTAALFLLDLAGPKGKSDKEVIYLKSPKQEIQLVERQIEPQIVKTVETEVTKAPNGGRMSNGFGRNAPVTKDQNGYKQMKDKGKRFDIYGKDVESESESDSKTIEEPVWSQIREGQYGKYETGVPFWNTRGNQDDTFDRPPSSPGDPGYVQYTAKTWGQLQHQTKTPRQSPTEV